MPTTQRLKFSFSGAINQTLSCFRLEERIVGLTIAKVVMVCEFYD
jgi:hypothetical protein